MYVGIIGNNMGSEYTVSTIVCEKWLPQLTNVYSMATWEKHLLGAQFSHLNCVLSLYIEQRNMDNPDTAPTLLAGTLLSALKSSSTIERDHNALGCQTIVIVLVSYWEQA